MSRPDDGGPAFPIEYLTGESNLGLSKRDYLAAQALTCFDPPSYNDGSGFSPASAMRIAKVAYLMADAMIAESRRLVDQPPAREE